MATPTQNTSKLDDLLKPHQEEFKALDLKRQMDEAERTFTSQKKKWDKELGKTLQRLTNMANNKPLDEGIEKDKPEESSEESGS